MFVFILLCARKALRRADPPMDPLSSPKGWLCTSATIDLTQSHRSLQSCSVEPAVDLDVFKSASSVILCCSPFSSYFISIGQYMIQYSNRYSLQGTPSTPMNVLSITLPPIQRMSHVVEIVNVDRIGIVRIGERKRL